jgi:hypothetical protein
LQRDRRETAVTDGGFVSREMQEKEDILCSLRPNISIVFFEPVAQMEEVPEGFWKSHIPLAALREGVFIWFVSNDDSKKETNEVSKSKLPNSQNFGSFYNPFFQRIGKNTGYIPVSGLFV